MISKSLDELIETVLQIRTREGMLDFFRGILTLQELDEIPTRLQIVKMLKKGLPHHEIAKKLSVGVSTVTRGSKELQKGRFQQI